MSATSLDLIAIQTDSTSYAGTFRALIGATSDVLQSGATVPSRVTGNASILSIANPTGAALSEPLFRIAIVGLESLGATIRSDGTWRYEGGLMCGSLGDFRVGRDDLNGMQFANNQKFWLGSSITEPSQSTYNFDAGTVTNANTLWKAATATVAGQPALIQRVGWLDTTNATRKGRVVWSVFDTEEREAIRIESTGSVANVTLAPTKQQLNSGSSDPTTSNYATGLGGWWKNTTNGEVRFWFNDGGVMKKSVALT